MSAPFYGEDLAYIHNDGFGGYAAGCAPGLLDILKRAGILDGLVVDVGCGGGLWAEFLVDAGYRVAGLDISPAMVALAVQHVPNGDFRVGSLWEHRFRTCRAVTALGEVNQTDMTLPSVKT